MSDPIPDETLAQWAAEAEAATAGPWSRSSQYGRVDVFRWPYSPGDEMVAIEVDAYDAAFIASARTAVPVLLAEVASLRAMLREATEAEFSEPCRLDHHGGCQAHGYLDGPCLIPRARAALATGAGQAGGGA